jgi:hypothetical protein
MSASRPKTVREIQQNKAKQDRSTITIYNKSKQMIPIHLNAPKNVDFYVGAQDIRLRPGQTYKFRKDRLRMAQVERLQKQGLIQVLHDSAK